MGKPYRTRLDPPPANGWLPPAELIASITDAAIASSTTEAPPQYVEEEFSLVPPPEPPQPRLDFATPTKRVQHLLIDGEAAIFLSKRKENGKLFVTARMEASGEEKTVTVPPAKVKILETD